MSFTDRVCDQEIENDHRIKSCLRKNDLCFSNYENQTGIITENRTDLGCELLNQSPPFRYFPHISTLSMLHHRGTPWNIWHQLINSLWPSDAIWPHRSGSTLAKVMACCLTVPSHYQNQCWLIISEVLWHAPERNFIAIDQVAILYSELENYDFKITATPRRGQWVKAWASFYQTGSAWTMD